ncbi:MAG: outer membrane protein assembly factor BamB family protein [Gaiellales bacterium]
MNTRLCVVVALFGIVLGGWASPGVAEANWAQYLGGPQHASKSAATVFTPQTAVSASEVWSWAPPPVTGAPAPRLEASPIVVGGRVYIGSETGVFYALALSTGKVLWQQQLDYQTALSCPVARGVTSTAAVLPDPETGALTVYVAGARYLYALDAATGTIQWQTLIGAPDQAGQNDYYNWSSPTVVAGHIYYGLSSSCDEPLIQGGVVELDQHTGQVQNTWHGVPTGSVGGSVWSSVAASADGRQIWVTTGNECDPNQSTCPSGNQSGDSSSIVHLTGALVERQAWRIDTITSTGVPAEFGASPTLFGSAAAGDLQVGACNKNGTFYALHRNPLSTSPTWSDAVGSPPNSATTGNCLAAAIWDAVDARLFIAANQTTIAGTTYGGSLRAVNPVDGTYLWQTGLPCAPTGSPSLDAAGVIAVPTYGACTPSTASRGVHLLDAATGAILTTLVSGSKTFAQPLFTGKYLLIAAESNGLHTFTTH